jgi:hypothetical protein
MAVFGAETAFFPADGLKTGQHMTVSAEPVFSVADGLQAGQHMTVPDAEIILSAADDLPAGPSVTIAVIIVGSSAGFVPPGNIFSGPFQAEIFRDAGDSDENPMKYVHETKPVKAGEVVKFHMAPGGGFIVHFTK